MFQIIQGKLFKINITKFFTCKLLDIMLNISLLQELCFNLRDFDIQRQKSIKSE